MLHFTPRPQSISTHARATATTILPSPDDPPPSKYLNSTHAQPFHTPNPALPRPFQTSQRISLQTDAHRTLPRSEPRTPCPQATTRASRRRRAHRRAQPSTAARAPCTTSAATATRTCRSSGASRFAAGTVGIVCCISRGRTGELICSCCVAREGMGKMNEGGEDASG